MNNILCNLNLCINLLYLLCLNKLDEILCLFIVKKNKKLEDKFIFYIYFESIWYMGYILLYWYKLVNKYNEINNVVEWLMYIFYMNLLYRKILEYILYNIYLYFNYFKFF